MLLCLCVRFWPKNSMPAGSSITCRPRQPSRTERSCCSSLPCDWRRTSIFWVLCLLYYSPNCWSWESVVLFFIFFNMCNFDVSSLSQERRALRTGSRMGSLKPSLPCARPACRFGCWQATNRRRLSILHMLASCWTLRRRSWPWTLIPRWMRLGIEGFNFIILFKYTKVFSLIWFHVTLVSCAEDLCSYLLQNLLDCLYILGHAWKRITPL